MGKRTKRILHPQLEGELENIDGREIHLLTWKGQTFFGLAQIVEGKKIKIEDKNKAWYNRRKHTHFFEISDIKEVLLDEISNW